MKGDFSRFTFDPKKNYSSVLMQQGRVILDADWNEQGDIQKHIRETEALDVIGRCGAPIDIAGFKVEVASGGHLILSPGRMYVDGKLCELDEEDQSDTQPIVDDEGPGTYLAYLDAWDRHITAVEDDEIREKALDGPDTATRVKTEWLFKLKQCDLDPENVSCREASLELKNQIDREDSRIAVRLQPPQKESATDPCEILSGRAYRGLENQLYRVEIHEPGEVGEATFKWSRNNGAVAFAVVDFIVDESEDEGSEIVESETYHKVKLKQLGWDQELRIHKDDWVEVLGDETELLGLPGTLARVEEIDESDLILTLTEDVAKHKDESNPKVRRWDLNESGLDESQLINGIPTEAASEDEADAGNGGWIELEDGIEVSFKAGDLYRTGDFWLIPARNTGEIEWPHDENDFVPKFGIHHHNCLLAILNRDQEGAWNLERDCRKLFPPLTDMIFLSYVGGDGQDGMPGIDLPAPLQVRVQRGGRPVEGAEVNFKISKGKGEIRENPEDDYADEITIATGDDGIAKCLWKFGDDQPEDDLIWTEQVTATLLYPEQEHPPSIQFNANASAASLSYVGGDGQEAMPGEELPAPLQARVIVGGYPLKNAEVKFEIVNGDGELRKAETGFSSQNTVIVVTGEDGVAACYWKFGDDQPEGDLVWTEQVTATLLYPEQEHPPSIQFNANAIAATLSYVGGDGQEAMPGEELPAPLQAMVIVGGYPLQNAEIEFKIVKGNGKVRENPEGNYADQITVTTGDDGIAECLWKFGDNQPEGDLIWTEQVTAILLYPEQEHLPSIEFNANASAASLSYVGGDGQEAMPGEELPAPLLARVIVGGYPLKSAEVKFEIVKGTGKIRETPADDYADQITVITDDDGIARCLWKFGDDRTEGDLVWTEQVEATLIKPGQEHLSSMLFGAAAVPLTLSYVGGDGQEAMPGDWLSAPFQVRAARGERPVEGAEITFEIVEGQGVLDPPSGSVFTGKDGMAHCLCRLEEESESPHLRVRAMLIDVVSPDENGDPSHPSIFFNANVSVAEEVAYRPPVECPQLGGAATVGDAIDGLCRQVSFSCVGGDGQEAMPGDWLPAPLQVRANRGERPVEGAEITFEILEGQGVLNPASGSVFTGKDGIAQVSLRFGEVLESPHLRVRAMLIDVVSPDENGDPSHPSIIFNANASVAAQVAYDPASCPHLSQARTVQTAIDALCQMQQYEVGATLWTHGHGMQIEYPERTIYVRRRGASILVVGDQDSANWFHFSVPTTSVLLEKRMKISKAILRFRRPEAGSIEVYVDAVHVYDGETQIAAFNNLNIQVPATWSERSFELPNKPQVQKGIGISVNVRFGETGENGQIEFSSAGSDFVV